MPTLSPFANAASDVFPGGSVEFICQFETYVNSGQATNASGVTIGVTASGAPDSGAGTPIATTSTGIRQLSEGLFTYTWNPPESTTPGSYLVTWTGVRASDSTTAVYSQAVNVAANPESVPLPGCYASVAQFRAWSGDTYTPAQIIAVKLQRATEDIDVALVAAVYRTDADGMPLDAQLANVLVRATSAQVAYLLAQNDDSGVKREYSSTSVGGVSATRAASQTGGALPRLAPRALSILRVAGVLPAAPLINWLQGVTMTFTIPPNASPGSPVTYEWLQTYMESQSQEAAAIAAIAGGFPGPGASKYLGWSAPVWHATSTASLTTTDIYVVAVYVPVAGTTTYMDVDATTAGTVTVADVGLFSLAGVQLAEALTANLTTNTAAWGAGINTWQWVTPAALTAGVYYATIETTSSAAPSLAASPASPVINYNLPANQYNYATYSTGTVPASITPSSLTGAVTAQPWVGIR